MVSNPIQLPKFPASSPDQLTRKQGAHYAQRVLRQLDQELEALPGRLQALLWCVEEMTRVRDAVALEHGDKGASFFEGVLGGLGGARNAIQGHLSLCERNRAMAALCRAKADSEKVATITRAQQMIANADSAHARLTAYADTLERSADAGFTLADGRFK